MDPLEDRVREGLRSDQWRLPVDPDDALDRIHTGAARRRRRRAAAAGIAAAAVVAAGLGGVGYVASGLGTPLTVASRSESGSAATLMEKAEPAPKSDVSDSDPKRTQTPEPEPSRARVEATRTKPPATPSAKDSYEAQMPANFSPVSMTAASARTFWVLGSGREASDDSPTDRATVAVTTDGGKTFAPLPDLGAKVVRGDNELSADTVRDIRFAGDSQNGWAFGGALWSTHDGGGSWARVREVPGLVERLETAGGSAFALVRDSSAWTLWWTPVDQDAWQQLSVKLNTPEGLAVADKLVAVTDRSADQTYAQVSTDGGTSFVQRVTPCQPDLEPGRLSASATSLWLTCATGTAATVSVSNDAGVTWSDVPAGQPSISATASELGARSSSRAIVAVPGQALIVGRGGTTSAPVPALGDPAFAGFTTDNVGYILDLDGKLFRTTDGGSSWSQVMIK
ncbi:hypothetical protein [Actinopolymorpha alba]|uniref:hypothetical protein n=1 Tax=Actinopolymorpha alba TaxID=533267 RepID=UPI00037F47EF|nr:hypothetical protein [Actinopolymorpha alba]